jgi:hypothetical protein
MPECDFFYSRIVFQHNPPPLIRILIKAGLGALRQQGIAIFQVPTYASGYTFHVQDYLSTDSNADMEMHRIPQPEIFSLIVNTGCRVMEVREDNCIGRQGSWISNTFIVKRELVHTGN